MDFFALPIEQQIELAREVAVQALVHYEFPADSELTLLKHRENTVFRATHPLSGARAVLRVHRTGYQTERSVISELQWMEALRQYGVHTPAVLRARDGAMVRAVTIAALPEPRLCDLLEFVDGRQPGDDELVDSFRLLGEMHARCHAHVRQWQLPEGFYRQSWDETSLLDAAHPTVAAAWDNWKLTAEQRALVLAAREALRLRLRQWGKGPDRFGLIHADLMPENLIMSPAGACLIDFDDSGFGWLLYDPASALLPYYQQDLYTELLGAWSAGYRSIRPLADSELSQLPTFLLLRCFWALGWLHARQNSEAAQLYTDFVIAWTCDLAQALLDGEGIPPRP